MPQVKGEGRGKNPIDAFILARLEAAGIQPGIAADQVTLLRRVVHDLSGLAPTPQERTQFLADAAPDAYERLVDRLLASPQFGERWAQHWLDVVRYSETEGYKLDKHRPDAWRYRDYVIRAFNDDMPYDRFVRQQLAGDELEPDNPDAIVATGFYRLHPEESNGSNYRQIRQDILDDVTEVVGLTFLGLTMGCARCHDHKFDPITQKDYFALQAFFTPLVQRDGVPLLSRAERARYEQQVAAWNSATREIRTEIEGLLNPIREDLFNETIVTFDGDTQTAMKTPVDRRTPMQRQLAALASKQILRKQSRMHRRLPAPKRARYDELQKRISAYDSLKPALPTAMAVGDAGMDSPATFRLANGDYLKPREEVRPDYPEFLELADPQIRPLADQQASTGRRSSLAEWLTRPDHPLTARIIVNRLWQHYFGRGLVPTPNDFGVMGGSVSHPELLDYLAAELVRGGWRLKPIHRLIVTSAAYQQASAAERNPTAALAHKVDPENLLLWHAAVRRRDAESIRDMVLQAAGRLNSRMGGVSAAPELPAALAEDRYSWEADAQVEDRERRSIYVFARRNLAYPLFAAFDAPNRLHSCPTRPATTTAPQALAMLNGELTQVQARNMASRLLLTEGREPGQLIRAAFLALYSREPSTDELRDSERFLGRQTKLVAPANDPLAVALADLCHALFNSAEFLDVE